jgi:hypothetical protein
MVIGRAISAGVQLQQPQAFFVWNPASAGMAVIEPIELGKAIGFDAAAMMGKLSRP